MPRIVIVGAGFGGLAVARALDGKFDVTIVDPKPAIHHNLAGLRGLWDEALRIQQFVPYPKFKDTTKFVLGEVVDANDKSVKLKSNEDVPYDVLVIATGSRNPAPAKLHAFTTPAEGLQMATDAAEAAKAATKIAIIGGGAVGIELAGELAHAYPDKSISLLHAGNRLLSNAVGGPALSDDFANSSLEQLQKMKVNVQLGTRLQETGDAWKAGATTLHSTDGRTFDADLVFFCTGARPHTQAFQGFLGSCIERNGFIKVNSHLQVEGKTNVFAVGDVTNFPESKLMYTADAYHAPVVAKNVSSVAKGKSPCATYSPAKKPTMFLVIGPEFGISEVGIMPFNFLNKVYKTGMFAKMKNSKRLFVEDSWKRSKQSMPATIDTHPLFRK